ncbi:MAG: DUF493 domain-containing protein [Halioglobus sp.]|nr:DUF493 domain-containing protein [Halioglobus sp.]
MVEHDETPKIEFPCDYPVKVLGRAVPDFETLVLEVFSLHAPGFDRRSISVRASSKGTFSALTVTITATGTEQLSALHRDLMATECVKMVI